MGVNILCLAPVVLLAFLQSGVDAQRDYRSHGRSMSDNTMTCGPQTCGSGAHCIHGSVRPVCACLPGHSGDPLAQCIRIECVVNSECRGHQACINQHCTNPCEGTCGINANCDVRNHLPVCSCPAGYTGDPFTSCTNADPAQRDYRSHGRSMSDNTVTCGPQTCGSGAHCIHGSVRPACACLPGHSGDPLAQCIRIECVVNSECRGHQACINQHCTNPCEGTCGINANCDVRNHLPVCSCPAGYTGDPFTSCTNADPEQA